jgi:hypothetical protein
MRDYFSKVYNLSEKELVDEIEKVNKRLLACEPGSGVYYQLLDMLDTVNQAYSEMVIIAMNKNAKDEVIEIGTIDKEEIEPDYTSQEITVEVARHYFDPARARRRT